MSSSGEEVQQKQERQKPTMPTTTHKPVTFLNYRGQSILEYLVVITIVVLALAVVRGPLRAAMDSLFNAAVQQANNAAGLLSAL
jgi:uncharacterized protein (UPF0333 family)